MNHWIMLKVFRKIAQKWTKGQYGGNWSTQSEPQASKASISFLKNFRIIENCLDKTRIAQLLAELNLLQY